jgi:hypothetical protein
VGGDCDFNAAACLSVGTVRDAGLLANHGAAACHDLQIGNAQDDAQSAKQKS